MTDKYQDIYARDAERYDAMVSAEDADKNLPRVLASLLGSTTKVVDIGCGTGRVTRALLNVNAGLEIVGVEPWPAMLAVARRRSPTARFVEGDAATLPVADGWADLAVAGWVYGHQCSWAAARWADTIGVFLAEQRRVVRDGGTLVVIETLGTGTDQPTPPAPSVAYYDWLDAQGFTRQVIDTSYAFASPEEAIAKMGFFFGERIVTRIQRHGWSRVPEWTALWSRAR